MPVLQVCNVSKSFETEKIIENISLYLKNGGMLYFEIGYNQGEAVKSLMENKFTDIRLIKDLSGHDRIVSGKLML